MKERYLTLAVLLFFAFLMPALASAEIFRYVDDNGIVYYTDAPTKKNTVKVTPGRDAVIIHQDESLNGDDKYSRFSSIIKEKATRYSLDPSLIHAVIGTESNFNHLAVSRKGAMGLMQLMPGTAVDMGVRNPFHPEQNIEGGVRYLRYLIDKFGDTNLALAAYNAGPESVKKYGAVPPIRETKEYVKKVMAKFGGKETTQKQTAKANTALKPASKNFPKKEAEPIYKVVLDDGTVMFTNTLPKKDIDHSL